MSLLPAPKRNTPLSESPTAQMMAERRKADKEKNLNAPRDAVPRANPATTAAEVPPGIAPIRPVPARKPGDGGAAKTIPMDTMGETSVPVDSPTLKPKSDES